MESVQLISLRHQVKPSAEAAARSLCERMRTYAKNSTGRHIHANNEMLRRGGGNEKRIKEPWSITCLPQSSPRERTLLFFLSYSEKGRGVGGRR